MVALGHFCPLHATLIMSTQAIIMLELQLMFTCTVYKDVDTPFNYVVYQHNYAACHN